MIRQAIFRVAAMLGSLAHLGEQAVEREAPPTLLQPGQMPRATGPGKVLATNAQQLVIYRRARRVRRRRGRLIELELERLQGAHNPIALSVRRRAKVACRAAAAARLASLAA